MRGFGIEMFLWKPHTSCSVEKSVWHVCAGFEMTQVALPRGRNCFLSSFCEVMQQFRATKRKGVSGCSLAATERMIPFCAPYPCTLASKRPVVAQPLLFDPSLTHMLDRSLTSLSYLLISCSVNSAIDIYIYTYIIYIYIYINILLHTDTRQDALQMPPGGLCRLVKSV